MMIFRGAFFCFCFLINVITLLGQDLHFTQYYNNPVFLNPSLTGAFTGNLRGGVTYRNQWRSISPQPFNTIAVFSDYKWFRENGDVFAGGLFFAHDNSGPGDLVANKIFLSGAFHKYRGPHYFSGGLQVGFTGKNFSTTSWPVQYIPFLGIFDPGAPNPENSFTGRSGFLDINAGISGTFRFNRSEANIGASVFHLNTPNESMFRDYVLRLKPGLLIHGRFKYNFTSRLGIEPSFLYMRQNKAGELIAGFYGLYRVNGKMTVKAGPFYRNNIKGYHTRNFPENVDAITTNLGISYDRFNLGISYDVNISALKQASNYRGGFELTLIYINPFEPVSDKRKIPCFRY